MQNENKLSKNIFAVSFWRRLAAHDNDDDDDDKHFPAQIVNSVTRKKSRMSIKVAQKMISLEKLKILTPLQKWPNNVDNLGKLIVAKRL